MFNKDNYSSSRFKPLKILFFIIVFMAFIAAVATIVMLLWNAILPEVTGVKPLNFWQAAGLLILAKILFGGFKGRGHWKHSGNEHWKNKWMEMKPEEREAAKSRWQEYCNRKKTDEKE